MKPEIILASSSVNRRKILEELNLRFQTIPSGIKEKKTPGLLVDNLVQENSRRKAEAVANNLSPEIQALIIAADSLAVFGGKILGKPAHPKEAQEMLRLLSGQTHHFYTGICVLNTETQAIHQDLAKTTVSFRKLTEREINDYVNSQPVMTMAGGYDITRGSPGEKFLANIKGSYTNVLGLPLEKLLPILEKYGLKYQK